MRNTFPVPTVLAVAALLSACNSTESLYASGPWAPGVGVPVASYGGPIPGYGGPLISPRPYDLDTSQDIQPGLFPRQVAPGRIEIDIPAAPAPYYDGQGLGTVPPVSSAPLAEVPSTAAPAPQRHAALPPAAPSLPAPATRPSSFAGKWTAVDAQDSSCRVQLSSTPSLDLYKASSSGCSNPKLGSVNGWGVRDGTVILFSRGAVVARLTGPEASLEGTLNGGGRIRMTR